MRRRFVLQALGFAGIALGVFGALTWITRPAPTPTLDEAVTRAAARQGSQIHGQFSAFAGPRLRALLDEKPSADLEELRWAAEEARESFRSSPPPVRSLLQLGTFEVLAGTPEPGLAWFERAIAAAPDAAEPWSDLAVAHLALGEADSFHYVKALTAADEALARDPSFAPAVFNQALALEKLFLREGAKLAWTRYLELDPRSDWATDARSRLDALSQPTYAERWEQQVKRQLLDAADRGDEATMDAIVAEYALASRLLVEEELLPAWGRLYLAASHGEAQQQLDLARALAGALWRVTTNALPRDAVAAVDRSLHLGDNTRLRAAAAGHVEYLAGCGYVRQLEGAKAESAFGNAEELLRRAENPFFCTAQQRKSAGKYARFQSSARRELLQELERTDPRQACASYPTVALQTSWYLGTLWTEEGSADRSLVHTEAMLRLATLLRDYDAALAAYDFKARALAGLGKWESSWKTRWLGILSAPSLLTPRRRYQLAANSAELLSWLDNQRAALHFQAQAVREAESTGEPRYLFEALQVQLDLATRLRDADRELEIKSKQRALFGPLVRTETLPGSRLTDAMTRRQLADQLYVYAREQVADNPRDAIRLINHSFEILEGDLTDPSDDVEPRFSRERRFFERATAFLHTGDFASAQTDALALLAALEKQRSSLIDSEFRASFQFLLRPAMELAVGSELAMGSGEAALVIVERFRALTLLETSKVGPTADPRDARGFVSDNFLPALQLHLPDGLMVLEILQLEDRTLLWSITRNHVEHRTVAVSRHEARRLVESYLRETAGRGPTPTHASELFSTAVFSLLGTEREASSLVVVPDEDLSHMPFPLLRAPGTPDRLIDRATLAVAPSLRALVMTLHQPSRAPSGLRRFLAVGISDLDPDRRDDDLPMAAIEATGLARRFADRGVSLTEERASVERVITLAADAEVIHFAVHGEVLSDAAGWSRLRLRPTETDDGSLTATRIASLSLPSTELVVLGACDAAAGVTVPNEGPMSLARAFLAAGVPTVVAPLWKVKDRGAYEFLKRFYDFLERGEPAGLALRRAQISCSSGPRSACSDTLTWSAFQIIGNPNLQLDWGKKI